LLEVGPGSENVVLDRLVLGPMRRPDQHAGQGIGGDCLRFLGTQGHEVRNVTASDIHFFNCDRSGAMFQRAVENVTLANSTIEGVGDTPIDFEPSPPGLIVNVALVNLHITRPPLAQGADAITIAGGRGVLVKGSDIDGGGIRLFAVSDVDICDNKVTTGPGAVPTIWLFGAVQHVRLIHNEIVRPPTAAPSALIRASHSGKNLPGDVLISDNKIVQGTEFPVLLFESASDITITKNEIEYSAASAVPIVDARAVAADVQGLHVIHNHVKAGRASALLRLAPRVNHAVGEQSDNRVEGAAAPFVCDGDAKRCQPDK
jgi:hypothetical protein